MNNRDALGPVCDVCYLPTPFSAMGQRRHSDCVPRYQIAKDNAMTVGTLCRAMIEQKASAVIVHIDGVEYKLSLKRQKP